MFSRFQSFYDHAGVEEGGRADIDHIDLRIPQNRFKICLHLLIAVPRLKGAGLWKIDIHHGFQPYLDPADLPVRLTVEPSGIAGSDHRHTEFFLFHRNLPIF